LVTVSRYPFKECANEVIKAYTGVFADSTIEVMIRRYYRMSREFIQLFRKGKVSTTNPKKFKVSDIKAYYELLKDRGVIQCTISHDLNEIQTLCKYYDNNVVESFRYRYPYARMGTRSKKRLPMKDFEYESILSFGNDVNESDFKRLRAYALVILSICAGLRSIELQYAKTSNLHLEADIPYIYLEVVKGMNSYGEARKVPLIPEGIPVIERYIKCSRSLLLSNNINTKYLFYSIHNFDCLCSNSLRKIRSIVEDVVGFKFDCRKCRRTYAQYLKDAGVSIESVSVSMGHTTTKTTEGSYARMGENSALSEVSRVLNRKGEKN